MRLLVTGIKPKSALLSSNVVLFFQHHKQLVLLFPKLLDPSRLSGRKEKYDDTIKSECFICIDN